MRGTFYILQQDELMKTIIYMLQWFVLRRLNQTCRPRLNTCLYITLQDGIAPNMADDTSIGIYRYTLIDMATNGLHD